MKNSKHIRKRPDIIIPAAALSEASFLEQGPAKVKVLEDMVILTRSNMSVREMEDTAAAYLGLASSLLDEYHDKTGEYPDLHLNLGRGGYPDDDEDDCEDCIHALEGDCDGTLQIPPCMLLDAGISPDAELQFIIRGDSIVITAVEDEDGDDEE